MNLTACPVDPCMYFKFNASGKLIGAIHTHVDDQTYIREHAVVDQLKKQIELVFPQVDNGPAKYVLGLQLLRCRKSKQLLLHQHEYVAHLLEAVNMVDCRPIDTPADPGRKLSKDMCPQTDAEREVMKKIPYHEAVGGLLYLVINTRPDTAFAVSEVSKYCQDPRFEHWQAVKWILRYLKGTTDYGIILGGSDLKLFGYTDTDWAGDINSRRSMSGFLSKMGSSCVQWKAMDQKCVTLSSFGSEIVALVSGAEQTICEENTENTLNRPSG